MKRIFSTDSTENTLSIILAATKALFFVAANLFYLLLKTDTEYDKIYTASIVVRTLRKGVTV